jgi:hypothetical protein
MALVEFPSDPGVRDTATPVWNGDADAIEDAVIGAWELQSGR